DPPADPRNRDQPLPNHHPVSSNALPNSLGDDDGRRGRGGWEQNNELVASVACYQVFAAHRVGERVCDFAQEGIARQVTVGVVDMFELVDVQEDDGEGALATPGGFDLLFDSLQQETPVDQPGEGVMGSLTLQAVVELRHLEARGELRPDRRHQGEVCLAESVDLLTLGIEHTDDPALADQREGQLGSDLRVEHDVTRVGPHIGDDLRRSVLEYPACDAGAGRDPQAADLAAAGMSRDLQLVRVLARKQQQHQVVVHDLLNN